MTNQDQISIDMLVVISTSKKESLYKLLGVSELLSIELEAQNENLLALYLDSRQVFMNDIDALNMQLADIRSGFEPSMLDVLDEVFSYNIAEVDLPVWCKDIYNVTGEIYTVLQKLIQLEETNKEKTRLFADAINKNLKIIHQNKNVINKYIQNADAVVGSRIDIKK